MMKTRCTKDLRTIKMYRLVALVLICTHAVSPSYCSLTNVLQYQFMKYYGALDYLSYALTNTGEEYVFSGDFAANTENKIGYVKTESQCTYGEHGNISPMSVYDMISVMSSKHDVASGILMQVCFRNDSCIASVGKGARTTIEAWLKAQVSGWQALHNSTATYCPNSINRGVVQTIKNIRAPLGEASTDAETIALDFLSETHKLRTYSDANAIVAERLMVDNIVFNARTDGREYSVFNSNIFKTSPASQPPSRPASKPTSKPTIKPAAKPTSRPTIKSTSKPTIKPTSKPTAKPTKKPTVKPTKKPTNKPTKKLVRKPSARTAKKAVYKSLNNRRLLDTEPCSASNLFLQDNLISADGLCTYFLGILDFIDATVPVIKYLDNVHPCRAFALPFSLVSTFVGVSCSGETGCPGAGDIVDAISSIATIGCDIATANYVDAGKSIIQSIVCRIAKSYADAGKKVLACCNAISNPDVSSQCCVKDKNNEPFVPEPCSSDQSFRSITLSVNWCRTVPQCGNDAYTCPNNRINGVYHPFVVSIGSDCLCSDDWNCPGSHTCNWCCDSCPAGYIVEIGAFGSAFACEGCKSGTYSFAGSTLTECTKCPATI